MFTLRGTFETLALPPAHSLSVHVGRAVFDIIRSEGALVIAEGASPRLGELNIGYDYVSATRFTSPQGVILGQGDRVVVGRKTGLTIMEPDFPDFREIDRGIAVYGPDGVFDEQRTEQLADKTLRLALNADDLLSRQHAEIAIVQDYGVIVRDVDSKNGIGISVQPVA